MAMLSQEPQPQPPTTKPQPNTRAPETWPYKGVKVDVWIDLEIKETSTGALKPTEGVLRMSRVGETFSFSGGFC